MLPKLGASPSPFLVRTVMKNVRSDDASGANDLVSPKLGRGEGSERVAKFVPSWGV